jgi:outer membrane murein-binding lipoprotein Lpp
MKTSRLLLLLAAGLSPVALLMTGCSKTDTASSDADKVKADASAVAADVKTAASDSWDSIKDYTYEKRVEFSASMDRMSVQLDDKTREIKAKFTGVPAATSKDRDSAVAEYDAARADLKARLADLSNATADTWADAKAKVAEAWKHVHAAYEKVKASS